MIIQELDGYHFQFKQNIGRFLSTVKLVNGKRGGNKSHRSKQNLPTKLCVVCNKPFSWRKKWERCWESVKYCSEKCKRKRGSTATQPSDRQP